MLPRIFLLFTGFVVVVSALRNEQPKNYIPGGSRHPETCYREDIFRECDEDHFEGCAFGTANIPTHCTTLQLVRSMRHHVHMPRLW
jgi:hypothetical protein